MLEWVCFQIHRSIRKGASVWWLERLKVWRSKSPIDSHCWSAKEALLAHFWFCQRVGRKLISALWKRCSSGVLLYDGRIVPRYFACIVKAWKRAVCGTRKNTHAGMDGFVWHCGRKNNTEELIRNRYLSMNAGRVQRLDARKAHWSLSWQVTRCWYEEDSSLCSLKNCRLQPKRGDTQIMAADRGLARITRAKKWIIAFVTRWPLCSYWRSTVFR